MEAPGRPFAPCLGPEGPGHGAAPGARLGLPQDAEARRGLPQDAEDIRSLRGRTTASPGLFAVTSTWR